MCNIAQSGWEQASLLIASVIMCFSTVSRISQAIIFATLKKISFFGGWALYKIIYESHKNTFMISLMAQMHLLDSVYKSHN